MYRYVWRALVFLREGKVAVEKREFPIEASSGAEADRIAKIHAQGILKEMSGSIHGEVLGTDLVRQGRFSSRVVYGGWGLRFRSNARLIFSLALLAILILYLSLIRPISSELAQIQAFLVERVVILHMSVAPAKKQCAIECLPD